MIQGPQTGVGPWDRALREKWITLFCTKGCELWLFMTCMCSRDPVYMVSGLGYK